VLRVEELEELRSERVEELIELEGGTLRLPNSLNSVTLEL